MKFIDFITLRNSSNYYNFNLKNYLPILTESTWYKDEITLNKKTFPEKRPTMNAPVSSRISLAPPTLPKNSSKLNTCLS